MIGHGVASQQPVLGLPQQRARRRESMSSESSSPLVVNRRRRSSATTTAATKVWMLLVLGQITLGHNRLHYQATAFVLHPAQLGPGPQYETFREISANRRQAAATSCPRMILPPPTKVVGRSAPRRRQSQSIPSTTTALRAEAASIAAAASNSTGSDDTASITGSDHLSSISTVPQPPPHGIFPRGDALDRRLIKISLPVIANFAIGPLIGAVDLFWVNQMGDALAVAGQAAANQVFNSVFWLTSFLPAVTATLISRENAGGNKEGVQEAVSQALVVGWALAVISTGLLLAFPNQVR